MTAYSKWVNETLLCKMRQCGIDGQMLEWISLWFTNRKQHVIVDGTESKWVQVKSGLPRALLVFPYYKQYWYWGFLYIKLICDPV